MQAKLQSKITLFLIKPIYELSETMDIRGPKWALKKKIAARKHATPLGVKPPLSLNPRNTTCSHAVGPLVHTHTHTYIRTHARTQESAHTRKCIHKHAHTEVHTLCIPNIPSTSEHTQTLTLHS